METARPQVEVHYEEPAELEREEAADPWYKRPMVRRVLIAVAVVVVVLLLYFNWGWITGGHWGANKLSSTNNAVLVPGDTSAPPSSSTYSSSTDENSKIVMDRAEVDRLRAQASANARPSPLPSGGRSSMTAPNTDSQSALAPNGAAFAGNGRYQFYRQGNLTWRLDTDNGTACVIFATDDEWRKPKVYQRGCGR